MYYVQSLTSVDLQHSQNLPHIANKGLFLDQKQLVIEISTQKS